MVVGAATEEVEAATSEAAWGSYQVGIGRGASNDSFHLFTTCHETTHGTVSLLPLLTSTIFLRAFKGSLCRSFLACVAFKCLSEPLTRDKGLLVLVQTTLSEKTWNSVECGWCYVHENSFFLCFCLSLLFCWNMDYNRVTLFALGDRDEVQMPTHARVTWTKDCPLGRLVAAHKAQAVEAEAGIAEDALPRNSVHSRLAVWTWKRGPRTLSFAPLL